MLKYKMENLMQKNTLTKTFTKILGKDLLKKTNWKKRLAERLKKSDQTDGSFGDIVASTLDAIPETLPLDTLLLVYMTLLNDRKTDKTVLEKIHTPLAEALIAQLEKTPMEKQDEQDIALAVKKIRRVMDGGRLNRAQSYVALEVLNRLVNILFRKGSEDTPASLPKLIS